LLAAEASDADEVAYQNCRNRNRIVAVLLLMPSKTKTSLSWRLGLAVAAAAFSGVGDGDLWREPRRRGAVAGDWLAPHSVLLVVLSRTIWVLFSISPLRLCL